MVLPLLIVLKKIESANSCNIVCLGQHLAEIELRLATALFFRTFPQAEVSTLDGMHDRDMDPQIFFLLSPKGKRCLISRG